METQMIDTFLEQLGLGFHIDTFKENGLELGLLKEMCEDDLEKTLRELNLSEEKQMIVAREIKCLKTKEGQSPCLPETSSDFESISAGDSVGNDLQEIRIVMLGKTGSGKSASCNTIFGKKRFQSKVSGKSITRQCHQDHVIRFGHKIVLVDTPGIFDTEESNKETQNEINRCVGITSPGPHAFVLVLNANVRYTKEESLAVGHFVSHFGENIFKYFIVLFTRKDDLDEDEVTLLEYVEQCPADLRIFIQKCGGRVFAFNNRLKNEEQDKQVKQLLDAILANVEKNKGSCYTHRMYEEAEKILKKVEADKMKRRREELKEELKKMEKEVSQRFKKKIEQAEEKARSLQEELSDVYLKQRRTEEQVESLKIQVEENKKMLKGSHGEEREDIQQKLYRLKDILEERKAFAVQGAEAIAKFENYSKKVESDRAEFIRNEREERRNMQRNFERRIEEEKSKIRDELRKEIEKTKEPDSRCTIL